MAKLFIQLSFYNYDRNVQEIQKTWDGIDPVISLQVTSDMLAAAHQKSLRKHSRNSECISGEL